MWCKIGNPIENLIEFSLSFDFKYILNCNLCLHMGIINNSDDKVVLPRLLWSSFQNSF